MNEEQIGSSGGVPIFPRRGEQWFECYICGFDYPRSEARRHYRTNRLVCDCCDDEKTHHDYLAERVAPREAVKETEQPVTCQGPAPVHWYSAVWYESEWADVTYDYIWYTGTWYTAEWYGDRTSPYEEC